MLILDVSVYFFLNRCFCHVLSTWSCFSRSDRLGHNYLLFAELVSLNSKIQQIIVFIRFSPCFMKGCQVSLPMIKSNVILLYRIMYCKTSLLQRVIYISTMIYLFYKILQHDIKKIYLYIDKMFYYLSFELTNMSHSDIDTSLTCS